MQEFREALPQIRAPPSLPRARASASGGTEENCVCCSFLFYANRLRCGGQTRGEKEEGISKDDGIEGEEEEDERTAAMRGAGAAGKAAMPGHSSSAPLPLPDVMCRTRWIFPVVLSVLIVFVQTPTGNAAQRTYGEIGESSMQNTEKIQIKDKTRRVHFKMFTVKRRALARSLPPLDCCAPFHFHFVDPLKTIREVLHATERERHAIMSCDCHLGLGTFPPLSTRDGNK